MRRYSFDTLSVSLLWTTEPSIPLMEFPDPFSFPLRKNSLALVLLGIVEIRALY